MDAEIPDPIARYLAAHRQHDIPAAARTFAVDAEVVDDGQRHQGLDAIRAWLARSSSEFSYTTKLTGSSVIDDTHFDVRQHLEGDFPGGQVDLNYRFTYRDGHITRLLIEV